MLNSNVNLFIKFLDFSSAYEIVFDSVWCLKMNLEIMSTNTDKSDGGYWNIIWINYIFYSIVLAM